MAQYNSQEEPGKFVSAFHTAKSFFKAFGYPNKDVAYNAFKNTAITAGIIAAVYFVAPPLGVAFTSFHVALTTNILLPVADISLAVGAVGAYFAGKHGYQAFRQFKYIADSEQYVSIREQETEKWHAKRGHTNILKQAVKGVTQMLKSIPKEAPFEGIRRADEFNQKAQPAQKTQVQAPNPAPQQKAPQQKPPAAGAKRPR